MYKQMDMNKLISRQQDKSVCRCCSVIVYSVDDEYYVQTVTGLN